MKNKMLSQEWHPVRQIKTMIFRGQETKFPLVTAMKNLLHMFTASVRIAREGQCTGVQNCGIGGKLVFLLGLQTNQSCWHVQEEQVQVSGTEAMDISVGK